MKNKRVTARQMEAFWEHYEPNANGCWLWRGCRTNGGYGIFCANGQAYRAHVLSYEKTYGRLGKDKPCVLHRCDNPPCGNPKHLFAGTKGDNMRDKMQKGRHVPAGTYCGKNGKWPRGEATHNAVLSNKLLKKIKVLRQQGLSYRALGKRFRVGFMTVWHALNGTTWRHAA